MSKFLKMPVKAIPMELDSSFTPIELINKLCYKINEIILNIDALNEKIDALDLDAINEKINNLDTKIDTSIQELQTHFDEELNRVFNESKQYTDMRINEILNNDTITASNYDFLGLTAKNYDDRNITAYEYDTDSARILIIN